VKRKRRIHCTPFSGELELELDFDPGALPVGRTLEWTTVRCEVLPTSCKTLSHIPSSSLVCLHFAPRQSLCTVELPHRTAPHRGDGAPASAAKNRNRGDFEIEGPR
jgi:hypothetical protein